MPGLKLPNLVVLHLYNYIKPKGQQDLLKAIESHCNAVKLSTCMRHVYILDGDALTNDDQKKAYETLVAFSKTKDTYTAALTFERFDAQEAYEFLLSWMIAGKNPKKMFDDCRIIGDVRELWEKKIRSSGPHSKALVTHYRSFFNALFTDAGQLRKLIGIFGGLDKNELSLKLKTACSQCAWARFNGVFSVLGVYDYTLFAEDIFLEELQSRLLDAQSKLLSKATLSSTGSEVVFFKSRYPVTTENLAGINKRLHAIADLLKRLNPEKLEGAQPSDKLEPISI